MSRQFVSPDIRGRVSSAKTPFWVMPFSRDKKTALTGPLVFEVMRAINSLG
jgi:hypothetical protein